MIDLVFKNRTSQKAPSRIFFQKILEIAAKELGLKSKVSLSVNLVREKKIQELNKKYRHKDKPTDVLSFPLRDKVIIKSGLSLGCLSLVADLGDIFICLPIAKNEAKRENITIKEKLARLVVHGFLHLQGYDHEKSEKDAKKMFHLEEKILSKIQNGEAIYN
ncbi:MAG: rRNA maturation RNase YbeY [Candidatus Yanofskybacteria bacterium RIFCSPHIGHO2_01_FULL_43_42]|uniref:Endoribonuclease YbeY n=1 Tax=Candidatus Yanofskybacteria bacterium RIFCSPLOWO2_01_FULL_43_22 TaxID=1802695 RepID=A0A1F8GEE9_9BACT|nr:MAG: rRNA maturation RNase YbeY [Candidatus Yanofskybacteria bacterium RIFCSPHIGHO2_01_FULL_43_42]OGN12546.1 MAG: rRNA maturation RNase YbeY [Candidatus Yanofskybacteria bacterium RIFCSPHIGHO2_02_FULL_43_17]OGN23693.1 MAG: rRNA maturation RNase YbeY [Candidatus Yanofskybacteria bacterium RIFCSPLOWO2_01_FULL_43_22]